jgi:hypothetical protein
MTKVPAILCRDVWLLVCADADTLACSEKSSPKKLVSSEMKLEMVAACVEDSCVFSS